MTRNPAREAAFQLLAKQDVDSIDSYLRRGRRFSALTAPELSDKFVSEMRRCASAPQDWPSQQQSDLTAEFALRGLEPPFEQVVDEMDRIAEHLRAAFAAASEDGLSKVHEAVERDWAALRKHWN